MGVVMLDPTLFADNLTELQDDAAYTQVILTGICNVSKVELYAAIVDGLESLGIRYGAMLNDVAIVMASADTEDYLEELVATIIELTGIEEIELVPQDDDPIGNIYFPQGVEYFGDIDDESTDFQKCNEDEDMNSAYELLIDFVHFAFECSIKVLTGETKDIESNRLVV